MRSSVNDVLPLSLRRSLRKFGAAISLARRKRHLTVLGFGDVLGNLIDPSGDDQGLLLDAERVPKRVRIKKRSTIL
jgi:hypothetical protein